MSKELVVTCRESRVLSYFRNIPAMQQDAVERILSKLNSEQQDRKSFPPNVVALTRKE
jgi:hypothetical protein